MLSLEAILPFPNSQQDVNEPHQYEKWINTLEALDVKGKLAYHEGKREETQTLK